MTRKLGFGLESARGLAVCAISQSGCCLAAWTCLAVWSGETVWSLDGALQLGSQTLLLYGCPVTTVQPGGPDGSVLPG